jgi:hypothetical protein
MKLKAIDTIRVSSAGGRKEAGETFEVNDAEAAELVRRGLAVEVGAENPLKAKTKAAPANKAARPSRNKGK